MKICSLIPSGTEIAFTLGLGDSVVGVTQYCNYPPEARNRHVVSRGVIDIHRLSAREVDEKVQELARSGRSAYALDVDWLVAVRPDIILTQDMCRSCDLEARDVFCAVANFEPKPNVLLFNPRILADIFTNIRRLAQATGVTKRAEQVIRGAQNRIERVGRVVADAPYYPRALFLEWTGPPSPAGDWIPEQVELAGGKPLLGQAGVAPVKMSWEAVTKCDPDVIIVGPCSHDIARSLREMMIVAERNEWWSLRAVRQGSVFIVDSDYFDRPGPRVVDGIEILAEILHPDLVAGQIPPNAVVKLKPTAQRPRNLNEIVKLFEPYPSAYAAATIPQP